MGVPIAENSFFLRTEIGGEFKRSPYIGAQEKSTTGTKDDRLRRVCCKSFVIQKAFDCIVEVPRDKVCVIGQRLEFRRSFCQALG